jgi:hypothetical protein
MNVMELDGHAFSPALSAVPQRTATATAAQFKQIHKCMRRHDIHMKLA